MTDDATSDEDYDSVYCATHGQAHTTYVCGHLAAQPVQQWPAEEVDGWEMAGVAAHVLGAQGVYRVPSANGFLFMAIMGVTVPTYFATN